MKKLLLSTVALLCAGLSFGQNRLIVMLKDGASAEAVGKKYGITLVDTTAGAPFALYQVPPGQNVHAVQDRMNADLAAGPVLWAEDDHAIAIPENQSSKGSTIASIGERQALYQQNTNVLRQIRFDPALARRTVREVRVALLDNGMSQQRGELWAKTAASANFVEKGLPAYDMPRQQDSNGNGVQDEAIGHGSMVAGIIDQIAPNAKLVVIRVIDSDGQGTSWHLVKGLAFAVANGAEVANVSLGSREDLPAINDVLEWCEQKGMVTVAAVGNDNSGNAMSPAASGKAISVAGVDATDLKATFSNWDGHTMLAAPATGIKSFWWDGTLAVWSGTSFAAPFVAGTIASGLQQGPRVSAEGLRKLFKKGVGDNIDAINPRFRKQLGLRLNYVSLVNAIRNGVAADEQDDEEEGGKDEKSGKNRRGRGKGGGGKGRGGGRAG